MFIKLSCLYFFDQGRPNLPLVVLNLVDLKQVKQVYNDQPLGNLALGKIGGGYGS